MALEEEFDAEIPDEEAEKDCYRSGCGQLYHSTRLIFRPYSKRPLSLGRFFYGRSFCLMV